MKFSVSVRAFALVSSLVLAGCGGGGGGGGGGGSTTAPQAVSITETNAKPVAADALEAVQGTSATQGTNLLTGVEVQTESASPASIRAVASIARLASSSLAGRTNLASGVAISESEACPSGGSISINGNVSGGESLVAGDNVTIAANNCSMAVDGVMTVMNGSMSMTIVSGSIGDGPFQVVAKFVLTDLSVQAQGTTVVVAGTTQLDWTSSSATSETMVASGASMTVRETVGTKTHTIAMKNFSQSVSVNGSVVTSSLSATIETSSTRLGANGGSYTITTPTPVVWNSSTKVLSAGVVKVVGANNSQLVITVTGNNAVSITDRRQRRRHFREDCFEHRQRARGALSGMLDQTLARVSPRPAVFALCLAGSLAAAEPAPVEWAATAGVRHRTLSEWSATGARLLTEKGFLPHLQLSAQLATPAWPTLAFEAGVTGGDLDYRGQTQSGVPLTTTTRHTDLELGVHWRPLPAAAWGEAWLGLDWLQARRNIASSPIAGGLDETSSLVLPGVRWRSPSFALPIRTMPSSSWRRNGEPASSIASRWTTWACSTTLRCAAAGAAKPFSA